MTKYIIFPQKSRNSKIKLITFQMKLDPKLVRLTAIQSNFLKGLKSFNWIRNVLFEVHVGKFTILIRFALIRFWNELNWKYFSVATSLAKTQYKLFLQLETVHWGLDRKLLFFLLYLCSQDEYKLMNVCDKHSSKVE